MAHLDNSRETAPPHVQVAEAIGWTVCTAWREAGDARPWLMHPPGEKCCADAQACDGLELPVDVPPFSFPVSRAVLLLVILVALAFALWGCGTHQQEFAANATPVPRQTWCVNGREITVTDSWRPAKAGCMDFFDGVRVVLRVCGNFTAFAGTCVAGEKQD